MNKKDNELNNLFVGDYLYCRACSEVIWPHWNDRRKVFKFKEVDAAYYDHLKKCMPLKRIVVSIKRANQ